MVAWLHRCTDVLVDVLEIETSGGTLLATSEPVVAGWVVTGLPMIRMLLMLVIVLAMK